MPARRRRLAPRTAAGPAIARWGSGGGARCTSRQSRLEADSREGRDGRPRHHRGARPADVGAPVPRVAGGQHRSACWSWSSGQLCSSGPRPGSSPGAPPDWRRMPCQVASLEWGAWPRRSSASWRAWSARSSSWPTRSRASSCCWPARVINAFTFLGLYAVIERRGLDMPWRQAGAQALATAVVGILVIQLAQAIPGMLMRRRLRRGY